MKTLSILLTSIALPVLFSSGAYACGKKGEEDKKETSAFELRCDCGKKGEDDKKETSLFDSSWNCGKKGEDDKKEA